MGAKNKVTVSVQPTTRRPTSAERRSAQSATHSSLQAKLKQEAADRRLKRAADPIPVRPRNTVRRSRPR